MRTATGSKSGLEAFNVLQQWRTDGAPDLITEYEAWYLTGGIVGNSVSAKPITLIKAAVEYTVRGGSLNDYLKLNKEAK